MLLCRERGESYQLKIEAHKQKMANMLASQCAEVVSTRERILRSKTMILRAWRRYKASGKKTLLNDSHDETNLEAGGLVAGVCRYPFIDANVDELSICNHMKFTTDTSCSGFAETLKA